MTHVRVAVLVACALLTLLTAFPSLAADAPVPKEGDWVVKDFRFHTGEVLPEVRLRTRATG